MLKQKCSEQENEIAIRNTRLVCSALNEIKNELEIMKLEEPSDGSISMSGRLDSFHEKVSKNQYWEPKEIKKGIPHVFTQPFSFYGEYVSLNLSEKAAAAENKVINYYKETLHELNK